MATADKLIELFNEARGKRVGDEREAFLSQACGADSDLKEQVLLLLKAEADEGESDFLKRTPSIRSTALITEKPGDRIGRYKLLQQLGEGGCGVVYMAEQEEPVRRRVALKVIKLGMDTKSVIARFEAERQALALMDHPNIAKVLDAGATDTGRPFFVMELVRGIKITECCDQNNLTTEHRLELFMQVCHAVQHAHQKGIIHRDLKPSNILVTLHDGLPVPKVIDFGVAKATSDQRLTDKTVFTAFEQFIGTPAYMSPEQAEMSGLDIDTRSDIYSLGVLLYELLTGRTPLDPEELLRSGMNELRRKIREDEPPRPSTRLSTMQAADLTTIAKHRQADVPKLVHLVHGDLDWIVMKCLEKDRTRRYETANDLANDLVHHMNNEPVMARPPSTVYRFQKFVRRNRVTFAASSAAALALMAGIAISIFLLVRENAATRRALVAERAARAERLRSEQATVLMTKSGTAFLDRGDFESAERLLLDALAMRRTGQDTEDGLTADLLAALAHLRHGQRDFAEAERFARECIEIRRRLGQDGPALARTINFLADTRYERGALSDAEGFFREGLTIMRRHGTNDPNTLQWSLYALAETLERQGKLSEAETLYRELIAGPNANRPIDDRVPSPVVAFARCLTELAWVEHKQGKSKEAWSHARDADALLREGLKIRKEQASDDDWQLAEIRSRLGGALLIATLADASLAPATRDSKFGEAEALLLEAGERLRDDPSVEPAFKRDALRRLVRLYESWNSALPNSDMAQKAAEWRQQLASFGNGVSK
jgi:eukaryotic-like serine/threonine-protein kinase